MKLCDLTQFYSPRSGGVKRYLHEKIAYIQGATSDEHVLVLPGDTTGCVTIGRSRTYTIRAPLVSRTARYRALLNLSAVEDILRRERPDLIECGDPYQIAWKAIAAGHSLRIPVVGFYHSHFVDAYFRRPASLLGPASDFVMSAARHYVSRLYNSFEMTLVPSEWLTRVLRDWGITNLRTVDLGVNTTLFSAERNDVMVTRQHLGIPQSTRLLLFVGRLAGEKNTRMLFRAFEIVARNAPGRFHLLVIGDGPEGKELSGLRSRSGDVTWLRYCADPGELARYYRAADLFVHPGTQETFGLVALESQACGTPVLGIRGARMTIFHSQDWWAESNTPEAFAHAITGAFAHNLPVLGAAAAARIGDRFAWPRVFERLFSIYREVYTSYTNRY